MTRLVQIIVTFAFAFTYPLFAVAQDAGDGVGVAVVAKNDVSMEFESQRNNIGEGDSVLFGASIITGQTGVNVDEMADNSRLSIAPRSNVRIDEFVYDAGGAGRATVRLVEGVMRFASGRMNLANSQIETPVAVLSPRGTVFIVAHSPSGGTTVVVEEGVVNFANAAGQSVDVSAGQSSTVSSANATPTAPSAPGPAGQAATAGINSALGVIGETATGNPIGYGRLGALVGAANAAAAAAPADTSPASFGGDGQY